MGAVIVSGDRPGRQEKLDAFDAAREALLDALSALIGDGWDKLAAMLEVEATCNAMRERCR